MNSVLPNNNFFQNEQKYQQQLHHNQKLQYQQHYANQLEQKSNPFEKSLYGYGADQEFVYQNPQRNRFGNFQRVEFPDRHQSSLQQPINTSEGYKGRNSDVVPGDYKDIVGQYTDPKKPKQDIKMDSLSPEQFTKYQLFYKKDSIYCQNLLRVLAKHPDFEKEIQKIDYDEVLQQGGKISNLKGVPTIIVGSEVYLGNRALAWVKQKLTNEIVSFDFDCDGYEAVGELGDEFFSDNFSFIFENSKLQDFDVTNLANPQNPTGRTSDYSLDRDLERLQNARENQISVKKNPNAGYQQAQYQQQQPQYQQQRPQYQPQQQQLQYQPQQQQLQYQQQYQNHQPQQPSQQNNLPPQLQAIDTRTGGNLGTDMWARGMQNYR